MTRTWDVLLVGGAAATGKSTAAAALARRYAVALTAVDDLHRAVLRMTTPDQQPVLHRWHTDPEAARWSAERIAELHLRVADELAPAVEAVIGDHLGSGAPLILEGDYLRPGLAALPAFDRVAAAGRVRAVFLYEPDERQIARNLLHREPAADAQDRRAAVGWLLGLRLRDEAQRLDIPVVKARPWSDLPERIVTALQPAVPDTSA